MSTLMELGDQYHSEAEKLNKRIVELKLKRKKLFTGGVDYWIISEKNIDISNYGS